MAALFQSGFLRAPSPADADFLYHPACLVDAFFRLRGRLANQLRVLESTVMREVEAASRATVKRKPVIVNSLRCYTRTPNLREEIPHGFPRLWGGHQFLRFCAEAFPALDSGLSLYVVTAIRTWDPPICRCADPVFACCSVSFHTAQRRPGSCLLACHPLSIGP